MIAENVHPANILLPSISDHSWSDRNPGGLMTDGPRLKLNISWDLILDSLDIW